MYSAVRRRALGYTLPHALDSWPTSTSMRCSASQPRRHRAIPTYLSLQSFVRGFTTLNCSSGHLLRSSYTEPSDKRPTKTMRVVIAGSGDLARYLCDEFTKASHEVTVLTRSLKPQFQHSGVTQFITDYTLQSLGSPLADADVLISTIGDITPSFVDVHRTLIQACQKSPKCKRFIPSEFVGDMEAHPAQPAFYYTTREPIRKVLREQSDLEWTLVSVGWLADYIVPVTNRYLKDIGLAFPISLTDSSIVIPGTGNEPVDFTWARDVARALVELVNAPAWEPYTCVSGEHTCWNDVIKLIKEHYQRDFTTKYQPLCDIAETLKMCTDEDTLLVADHQMFSVSQASSLPQDRVQAQRRSFFPGIRFQTLQDGLEKLGHDTGAIL